MRRDADDIALSSGESAYFRGASAHAVVCRFGGRASVIVGSAAADIALIRGRSWTCSLDKDHAVVEIVPGRSLPGGKSDILLRAAADIDASNGGFLTVLGEQDHTELLKSSGPAERRRSAEDEIAVSSGTAGNTRVALDHDRFEIQGGSA